MSFWQAKTKIRKSDQLFSIYIRCRDGDCVYKKKCQGGIPFKKLTNSHYYKRSNENLRYDPDNCDSACRACHQWAEDTSEGQAWLAGFKLRQLGQNKMNLLAFRKQNSHRHSPMAEIMAIASSKTLLDSLSDNQKAFAKQSLPKRLPHLLALEGQ